ncbi:MAG: restriction endonuclease subunit S [Acidobacteriota bacterium]|nr:restriction endonuclease subunit S [Acidobacteriota bacterium]
MDKNSNRPGYKMTKAGWIPEDWIISTLGKSEHFLTSGSRGWSQYYCDRGELFVRITNLSRESINLDYADCRFVKLPSNGSEGTRTTLNAGDILVSITADLGIIGYFSSEEPYPRAYVNQHVALLRILDTKIYSKFVAYQLAAPRAQKRFRQITDQGAKAGLNLSSIRSFPVAFPSLAEQEGIAEVLECWDRAIRVVERKIEKKREIKKGLMQQLLTGKRRLPGFGTDYHEAHEELEERRIPEGWKEVRLGEVVAIKKGDQLNRLDQTDNGDYPVLNGGIQPLGYTDRWNTEANKITISEGGNSCGFVSFNKERFWCGGHCYALDENEVMTEKNFLYQYLKYKQSEIMRLRVGSGLPNIQKKTLEQFSFSFPELPEQKAIAGVLAAADGEIGALERKLGALREQKRFLLNNLVTGTIRLPEFRRELP